MVVVFHIYSQTNAVMLTLIMSQFKTIKEQSFALLSEVLDKHEVRKNRQYGRATRWVVAKHTPPRESEKRDSERRL